MSHITPFVTILILNFNGSRYLSMCITSVLQTDYPRFEVIVVDNASVDNSLTILDSFKDERLRIIISKTNLGFAEGNNLGFKSCQGEYVVFLNNDTRVEVSWLKELVDAMELDPDIGAAQSKLLLLNSKIPVFDSTGDFIDHYGLPASRARGCLDLGQYQSTEEVFSGRGAALMVRRGMFKGTEPFDPDFYLQYEDIDLSWRLRLLGYKIIYVPRSLVYHVGVGTPSSYRVFHARKNAILLLVRNYSVPSLVRYLPGHLLIRVIELVNDSVHNNLVGFKAKFKAYIWILRNLRKIMVGREEIQSSRRVSDNEALRLMANTSFLRYALFMKELVRVQDDIPRRDRILNVYFQEAFQKSH